MRCYLSVLALAFLAGALLSASARGDGGGGGGGTSAYHDCELVSGTCKNPTSDCTLYGGICQKGGSGSRYHDPNQDGCGCLI